MDVNSPKLVKETHSSLGIPENKGTYTNTLPSQCQKLKIKRVLWSARNKTKQMCHIQNKSCESISWFFSRKFVDQKEWHDIFKVLQYSCLENPMDAGAWQAAVHGVMKSQTWLRNFTFTFHFYALEKEMATHSSVLAWRIPGIGSHRVGHNLSDLAVAVAFKVLKGKTQPRTSIWWS